MLKVVRGADAEAVITPNLGHFGDLTPTRLVAVADLITVEPAETYQRWIIRVR